MSARRILVLDASAAGDFSRALAACVERDGADYKVISCVQEDGKKAAEGICAIMRSTLQEARWDRKTQTTPDLVAVIIGPGSFTGLRASCAAGQGYGLALGIDVVGLLKSDALRERLDNAYHQQNQIHKELDGWLFLSQARRGQVFVEDGAGVKQLPVEAFQAIDGKKWLLAGELRDDFPNQGIACDIQFPTAIDIAKAAVKMKEEGKRCQPVPYYVEPPRAKLPRAK